ncbi:MFS transporter [Longispora sp. NPDC051575]|uniref:MFS transporter n=1 Tax=Longispora sp. NPDC051575 TaxID=3154943 RepID=UPI0034134C28
MTQPFPTAPHQPAPSPGPGPRPAWLLIGPTIAASLGAFLALVTVGPEWTAIQRDLALANSVLALVLVAYLLPAILAAGVGALVGWRWPTSVAVPASVLLMLGALLTAFAPDSVLLLVGRAVTGLGAGLAWGVTGALVARMARRGVLAAVVAGAVLVALVLGPVVGAVTEQLASWRLPFLLALPVGIVALLIAAVGGIVLLTGRASRPTPPQTRPSV